MLIRTPQYECTEAATLFFHINRLFSLNINRFGGNIRGTEVKSIKNLVKKAIKIKTQKQPMVGSILSQWCKGEFNHFCCYLPLTY